MTTQNTTLVKVIILDDGTKTTTPNAALAKVTLFMDENPDKELKNFSDLADDETKSKKRCTTIGKG